MPRCARGLTAGAARGVRHVQARERRGARRDRDRRHAHHRRHRRPAGAAGRRRSGRAARRAVKRGRNALDALDELKIGLLSGTLDTGALARLKAAPAALAEPTGDPGLDAVLAEIELRVEVELAKIGMPRPAAKALPEPAFRRQRHAACTFSMTHG